MNGVTRGAGEETYGDIKKEMGTKRWGRKEGKGGETETEEACNQPDILPYIYSSAFWIMKRSRWASRFCHSLQDARTLAVCVCVYILFRQAQGTDYRGLGNYLLNRVPSTKQHTVIERECDGEAGKNFLLNHCNIVTNKHLFSNFIFKHML